MPTGPSIPARQRPRSLWIRVVRKSRRSKWLSLALGWSFVAAGLAGALLPILPGALFLLLGIWFLAPHIPAARRLRHALRSRLRSVTARYRQRRRPAA